MALDVLGDGVQEVRLADARRAAEEQRVVGGAGVLGDCERRRVREAVARAEHELVEAQLGVERRVVRVIGSDGSIV